MENTSILGKGSEVKYSTRPRRGFVWYGLQINNSAGRDEKKSPIENVLNTFSCIHRNGTCFSAN
jgi:hypothetical protein